MRLDEVMPDLDLQTPTSGFQEQTLNAMPIIRSHAEDAKGIRLYTFIRGRISRTIMSAIRVVALDSLQLYCISYIYMYPLLPYLFHDRHLTSSSSIPSP